LAGEQDLNASPEKIARSWISRAERLGLETFASPVQACREHAGIVEDYEIIGAQKIGELPEIAVLKRSIRGMQVQKPRCSTVRQRLLSDQLLGKVVAEIGDEHLG
jgi:hypothetical protein